MHPAKPVEAFGRRATTFLSQLALGREVRLEYDEPRTDRFGRALAYLHLEDGTFINAEIVRQGYGHAYTRFPFKYLDEFRAIEREAREHKRGLWREPEEQTSQEHGETAWRIAYCGNLSVNGIGL